MKTNDDDYRTSIDETVLTVFTPVFTPITRVLLQAKIRNIKKTRVYRIRYFLHVNGSKLNFSNKIFISFSCGQIHVSCLYL